jgi:hypothetical protein
MLVSNHQVHCHYQWQINRYLDQTPSLRALLGITLN